MNNVEIISHQNDYPYTTIHMVSVDGEHLCKFTANVLGVVTCCIEDEFNFVCFEMSEAEQRAELIELHRRESLKPMSQSWR